MSDFSDSLEKIVLGAARKIVLSDADRRRTAYHEAGHALTACSAPAPIPSARSRSSRGAGASA